ncbi:MAG: hypothetical protein CBD26_03420 [Candidatus Pelagibacter sp. TMED166]|nr:MAG: hypothetical protein CBD26_03420 [Candidatus Pelagibacter sp. TMED166]
MRLKHNKKRNTAFVYEALVRELTKAVIKKDNNKKKKVVAIIKEFYSNDTELFKELRVYKSLYETSLLKRDTAEKLIFEAKYEYNSLNKSRIYKEQSRLIKNINTVLSSGIYSNFVPNYKTLASIQSIFNNQNSIRDRVLLEEKLVEFLTLEREKEDFNVKDPVDNLIYRSFVKRFNEKYNTQLNENQKTLLTKYVTSFVDDGLELKVFLNEEIGSLKRKIAILMKHEIALENSSIKERMGLVLEKLESFRSRGIDDDLLSDVLRVQSLVSEMETNGN